MKPIYRYDIIQNSEEWEILKYGKLSASVACDLLMDENNKGYQNLFNKIIEERITRKKTESKSFSGNQHTERGHELEPIAREDYELRTFNVIAIIGCVEFDDWVLCSPDGLEDKNGLHQIKCPIFNTQRSYIKLIHNNSNLSDSEKLKKISSSYYKQCQFELYVTNRDYCVVTFFHPKLKAIDLKIIRDIDMLKSIHTKIEVFKLNATKEIEFLKEYVL